MSATPRLYVDSDLAEGLNLAVVGDQAHYLARVLRLGAGAPVRLFNGRHGEFDANIESLLKFSVSINVGRRVREQTASPDLWLLFSPLKKTRTDFVVEKATELGVSEILPVFTERTDAETVRTDRLTRLAIEAAEQTERLDVPRVHAGTKLETVLAGWNPERSLIYADEAGDEGGKPWGGQAGRAMSMAASLSTISGPAAVLIGPEGGFSPAERKRLRDLPYVKPVSLGPRILRAETAAVAALAVYQALAGDWHSEADTKE